MKLQNQDKFSGKVREKSGNFEKLKCWSPCYNINTKFEFNWKIAPFRCYHIYSHIYIHHYKNCIHLFRMPQNIQIHQNLIIRFFQDYNIFFIWHMFKKQKSSNKKIFLNDIFSSFLKIYQRYFLPLTQTCPVPCNVIFNRKSEMCPYKVYELINFQNYPRIIKITF